MFSLTTNLMWDVLDLEYEMFGDTIRPRPIPYYLMEGCLWIMVGSVPVFLLDKYIISVDSEPTPERVKEMGRATLTTIASIPFLCIDIITNIVTPIIYVWNLDNFIKTYSMVYRSITFNKTAKIFVSFIAYCILLKFILLSIYL